MRFFLKVIKINNRIQLAHDFAKKIKNNHIKEIVLFGSVARGEDTEFSDIDILIIADDEELIEEEVSDEVMNILLYKKEHISAHVISEDHYIKTRNFSFLRNVYEDGIILE